MSLHFAALAASVVLAAAPATPAATRPETTLSLDEAFARVADNHPELRMFAAQRETLRAEREQATQRPPLVLGASIENALGSGALSGFDESELTLSLASVFERGGKLDARRTLAQSRIDALAVQREVKRLDLLAETARRYLAVVARRQQAAIARADVAQRKRAVETARQRHRAGAAPRAQVLTAEAELARARLDEASARQQIVAARRHLAALWGGRQAKFQVTARSPLSLPQIAEFSQLAAWLERNPELHRFADRRRIREARLQLAQSRARADVSWQVGVRRMQGSGDVGLIASLSIPLGSEQRAQPAIRAARSDLAALAMQREAANLALYSTLAQAHGRYRVARLEVMRLAEEILPRLDQAEQAAAHAYRAGASSYLAWNRLQAQRINARRRQLAAAIEARRALIEIQRLTGQAFVDKPSNPEQSGQGEPS